MAELAPMDEKLMELGIYIPVPIAPDIDGSYKGFNWNHHHAYFPRNHEELLGSNQDALPLEQWKRVLRWSRLQYSPKKRAHNSYHTNYEGVELPGNIQQRFLSTVMSVAGYIPETVIDLNNGRPVHRRARREEIAALHQPGAFKVESTRTADIGLFFGCYILENGLCQLVDKKEINKFLHSPEGSSDRLHAGFSIIRQAAGIVLDEIEPVYQRAWEARLIPPTQPSRATRFMTKHFRDHQPEYFETMQGLLRSAA